MSDFLAGFAEVDYTPAPGLAIAGQHYVRIAEKAHDPLMANAVAMRGVSGFEQSGNPETIVMVSLDLCILEPSFIAEMQQEFEKRTRISAERLLINATHCHVAPVTIPRFWGDPDPAFMESLKESILGAAQTAIERLEPVTVYSGMGKLDHLNWNRRCMYADGASHMHGSADREGFIGEEPARDPNLGVIFCRNSEGTITGVIANFGTHPNTVEHALYYSADIPGEARRLLKLMLGSNPVVVHLTGAAGNVSPVMHRKGTKEQPWMGEEGLTRAGLLMAGEIGKVIAQAIEPIQTPTLSVKHTSIQIPIRPFAEPGSRNYPAWGGESVAFYAACEADWPRKIREESPVEVRITVTRIGDTVICTNPAEIFSEFALELREASDARVTLISQLTDGYCGYIPTLAAFERGGYETWPCTTSKLAKDAGDRIVEATKELLAEGR